MKKALALIFTFLLFRSSVAFGQDYYEFVVSNPGSYEWTNDTAVIGEFFVTDTGNSSYYIVHQQGLKFDYKTCLTCPIYQTNRLDFWSWSYNTIYFALALPDDGGIQPPPDPEPDPLPDPDPPPSDPGGGTTVGATLPRINLMNDSEFAGTLWNYLGSVFTLGMPFLLIAVALLVLAMILDLLIDVVKKAREDNSEDFEDNDDW